MSNYSITKLSPDQIEDTPVITTEIIYAKRVDFADPIGGNDIIYKGWALPGSSNTDPVWRVVKLTINTDGDVMELWANGQAAFESVWNDRAILTYS